MKKNMHKILTAALLSACSLAALATPQTLDRVVAVVNQDVVLASQLDSLILKVQRDSAAHNQPLPEYGQLRKQALDRLIGESLVVQLADRQGLKVSDTQLDQTLASIAAEQKMSIDQLKQEAAADGLSEAQFREQIRREMLIRWRIWLRRTSPISISRRACSRNCASLRPSAAASCLSWSTDIFCSEAIDARVWSNWVSLTFSP